MCLPEELLLRCLGVAGARAVACAACCCKALRGEHSPLFIFLFISY